MPVKTMCVLNVANTTLSFLFAKIIMCFVNIVKNSLCYSQNQILYKIVCIPQHINHMNNETRITMLPSNHYDDRFNSIQNLILNPLHDSRFFFFFVISYHFRLHIYLHFWAKTGKKLVLNHIQLNKGNLYFFENIFQFYYIN